MDLISQLPEALLHEILHLLPEMEAVQTCVLSRAWSDIQYRRPYLCCDEFDFPPQTLLGENTPEAILEDKQRKKMFVDYVDRRLERLSQYDSPPLKLFMLSLIEFNHKNDPPRIDSWLKRVHEKGVKCIILRHLGDNDLPLNLPRCVLASQTLNELTLTDCMVNIHADIKIPNLQKMLIFNVNVDDDFMKRFLSGCPLLEELSVNMCDALNYLQANNLALLERVALRFCSGLSNVEILSPKFQSFKFIESASSSSEETPKLILALSKSIKKINLAYVNITTACLQQCIPTCVELNLTGIPDFESAKFSGNNVSNLTIKMGKKMTKVPVIDCPNLQSLVYVQNKLPFHVVKNFKPMMNIRLQFDLEGKQECDLWLAELKGFFDKLDSKQELIMIVSSKENEDVIIVDGLVEVMLPMLHDIKGSMPNAGVMISSSLELDQLMKDIFSYESIVSCMTLNVVSAHSSDSIFLELLRMKADANCCKDRAFRCWQHYSCNLEKDNANNSITAVMKSYQPEEYQLTTILVKRDEIIPSAIPAELFALC